MRLRNLCRPAFPLFFAVLLVQRSTAFESSAFGLQVPGTLDAPCLDIHIEHRFYTSVTDEPLKNAFGFNGGVVADVGLRWVVWDRIQTVVSYQFLDRNAGLGFGYSYTILDSMLNASVGFSVYNYGITARTTATFPHLALSGGPFFKRITPAVNVGYDSDDRHAGIGLGVNAAVFDFLDVAGEYFPIVQRIAVNESAVNVFAFGVILKTYGHHFSFFLSNTSNIGMMNSMKGADNNDLHFGFRINRLFDFGR